MLRINNKRIVMAMILAIMLLTMSGCKKQSSIVDSTNIENTVKETTKIKETTGEKETDTTVNDETTKSEENPESNNPTEDVYQELIEIEEVSEEDIEVIEDTGVTVTDGAIISELEELCDLFFYNFLFAPDEASGVITEVDMQSFAISYMYQYEYNELKFDFETFLLHIPEEKVSEIIRLFFSYDFYEHVSPQDERIVYKDGFYLMSAVEDKDVGTMAIQSVTSLQGDMFLVKFEEVLEYAPIDAVKSHYEATFKQVNGKYILVNYRHVIDPVEEEVNGESSGGATD